METERMLEAMTCFFESQSNIEKHGRSSIKFKDIH